MLHIGAVGDAVSLRTQRMYGRTFAAVEHAVLDACRIRCTRHFAAQRVNLADEMPLGCTADRWVTGHIADRVQVDCKTGGFHPQPCSGQRGLNACMTRPYHGNIIWFSCKARHAVPSF